MKKRCAWAGNDPLYIDYHDREWGVPIHNDQKLFEFLILEGAQAGLSWITILKRRENYRKAFDQFDFCKVAEYDSLKIRSLLADAGIIRNRLKIESAVTNARAFIEVRREFGSFDRYLRQFAEDRSQRRVRKSAKDVPAQTPESDAMSKDLKKKGFRFVGSTICYAFMQAVGLVDDHTRDCFRWKGEEG